MRTVSVQFPQPDINYSILIGKDCLSHASDYINFSYFSKLVIIIDEDMVKHYLKLLKKTFPDAEYVMIRSGEHTKTIETVIGIWREFMRLGVDRKSLVINFGGGVITDIGGFSAATYMRGMPFLQVPTTLLGMVDASVGGKTGVNFEGYKNIIGAFEQPIAVICDTAVLDTLPDRQLLSGHAEIMKYGLIADRAFFFSCIEKSPTKISRKQMEISIQQSCELKKSIIAADERESGKRKLLNFGHTIGHALESYSHETEAPLLHGEAISIGMVAEAKISELIGMLPTEEMQQVEEAFLKMQLPVRYHVEHTERLIELMKVDKKNVDGHIMWTLIEQIGWGVYDNDVEDAVVMSALQYISAA